MQQASDYELELMKIIWANNNSALYTEIYSALESKGFKWTKNTVITLLLRLIEKKMLKTSKVGRKNIYHAIVAENEYQAEQTSNFVNKLFEGSTKGLVAALIEKNMLSSNDYEELRDYWKKVNETK